MAKATFGNVRRLPSGRYQARYTDPDGITQTAPYTFDTKTEAHIYLATVRTDITRGEWAPPRTTVKALTFGDYSHSWLEHRRLEARTRDHYRRLLERFLLPTFVAVPVRRITPTAVREWYACVSLDRPTQRAHAYGLLRTIMGSAEKDELIDKNPVYVRGAGNTKRVHKVRPATLVELEVIVTSMPERLRLMVLLAAWCALRFGELAELRREDVDTRNGLVRIRRGVVRANGQTIIKAPKSDAGTRDVAIPPHLLPLVREHLLEHTQPGAGGLLFHSKSGGNLSPSSFYGRAPQAGRRGWGYYAARAAAERPDLHFHDLRHTGAVLAARTGATLAELMGRLGHSTPGAAMRYQHTARDRDAQIATALSELAAGTTRGE